MNFIQTVSHGLQLEAKKGERSKLREELVKIETERADLISRGRIDSLLEIMVNARNQLESEVFTPLNDLPDAPSTATCRVALDELIAAMDAQKVNPVEALRELDARKELIEKKIKSLNTQLDKLRGKTK